MTKQYSSFWIDENAFDVKDDEPVKGLNLHKVTRLAAVRRAIGNFVSIMSGQNLPVEFSSGKESYTTGERVIISADDNPDHFDVMVGLALHEGSHILKSDFTFLKSLKEVTDQLNNHVIPHTWVTPLRRFDVMPNRMTFPRPTSLLGHILKPELADMLPPMPDNGNLNQNYGNYGAPVEYFQSRYWSVAQTMIDDLLFIMNMLEDRRIDKWVWQHAQGYRPYYQALYNRYFFTTEIGRNLRFNPKWREITVPNYLDRLLYAFHPEADPNALPGLSGLIGMMDMDTIERLDPATDILYTDKDLTCPAWYVTSPAPHKYEVLPKLWKQANDLYYVILMLVKIAQQTAQGSMPSPNGQPQGSNGEDGEQSDKEAPETPDGEDQDGDSDSAEDEQDGKNESKGDEDGDSESEGGDTDDKDASGKEGNQSSKKSSGHSVVDEMADTDPSQLPNLDTMPKSRDEVTPKPVEKDKKGKGKKEKEVEGRFNEKKAEKDKKEAQKVMKGEMKKKKVTDEEKQAVTAIEEAAAEMVDLTGNGVPYGDCMVTRKMSDGLLQQDWFSFKHWNWQSVLAGAAADPSTEAAIAAGRRMGAILHHRLQVRNDPTITKQTRLIQGGLDRRLLAQLGMDIESVFQKSRTDIHKPVMLHLTLDASGSMAGKKWEKVLTVAVALAYIGSKLRNVDTVISIRGGSEMPMVIVVFDSRKDQFPRFVKYARLLRPNGATPEGLCFTATMDIILEMKDTHDVYFINFSDGEPAFHINKPGAKKPRGRRRRWYAYGEAAGFDYSYEAAYKHTRAMVQMMRENGVKVLSYFIEDKSSIYGANEATRNAFRQMYGDDAAFVNVENAAEVIRTLNKLLLVRG